MTFAPKVGVLWLSVLYLLMTHVVHVPFDMFICIILAVFMIITLFVDIPA